MREQNEWDEGHLSQSQLLPMSIVRKINEDDEALKKAQKILGKDKIIYTHCRRGGRALQAGKILQPLGYEVRPLELGFEALVAEGLEQAK